MGPTGRRPPVRWQEVMRFADVLVRAAERDPGHDAVVLPEQRVGYRDLLDSALLAARSLAGCGIGPGSRVGVLMPNCVTYVKSLFAISLLGAVMVPINARFAPRELAYVIEHGDLDALLTSDMVVERVDYVRRIHEALPSLASQPDRLALELPEAPCLRTIVLFGEREVDGMIGARELAESERRVGEEDVWAAHARTPVRGAALMMFTSGTTAMPKGCVLSHEALVRTAAVAGRTRFRLSPEDRFWDPLPMFHMSAILPLLACFDAGSSFMSMVHFEADLAMEMLDEQRATVCYATFPAITQSLLNHPAYHADRWRYIRLINNVAPSDTLRLMQEQMPHTVQISAYGCTECGGVVSFNDPDDSLEQRCTTTGKPFTGIEVDIRDLESGAPVPAGERGEILVRGYSLFDGYYRDPALTAQAVDSDGWFHTGDIGALTAEGRLCYLGRVKDMLKVGGENVAAVEIESYISLHPAVSIVAVVGVPDPRYTEVPAAFIELRPGAELSEQEVVEHCRRGLASFKVPRHVRFLTQWPMSATKVQKFRLQETLTAELEAERAAGSPSVSARGATASRG